MLQIRAGSRAIPRYSRHLNVVIYVAEYVLAAAAFVNVVLNSWELGLRGVTPANSDTVWLPLFWALVSIAIHIGGATALILRVRLHNTDEASQPRSNTTVSNPSSYVISIHYKSFNSVKTLRQPPLQYVTNQMPFSSCRGRHLLALFYISYSALSSFRRRFSLRAPMLSLSSPGT